jgi:hypothetical protein
MNNNIKVKFIPIVHSYRENIKRNIRTIPISDYIDLLNKSKSIIDSFKNSLYLPPIIDGEDIRYSGYIDPNSEDSDNSDNLKELFKVYDKYQFLTTPITEIESPRKDELAKYYDVKFAKIITDIINTPHNNDDEHMFISDIKSGNIHFIYNNYDYIINTKNHKITFNPLYIKEKHRRRTKWLMSGILQKDVSLYELLDIYSNTKIYFDIENIDSNEPKFIYNIIRDLKKFVEDTANIKLTDYVLTINKESATHDGLSYHLIFNHYYTTPMNIKGLLLQFIEKYSIYKDYIDTVVYSKNRIFKSVYQLGIDGYIDNRHDIIEGTIEDSIIQNINNCDELKYEYKIPDSMKDYMTKNHSWIKNKDKTKNRNKNIDIQQIIKQTVATTLGLVKDECDEDDLNNLELGIFKRKKEENITVDEIYGIIIGLKMKDLNEKQHEYLNKLINDYDKNKLKDYNLIIVKSTLSTF